MLASGPLQEEVREGMSAQEGRSSVFSPPLSKGPVRTFMRILRLLHCMHPPFPRHRQHRASVNQAIGGCILFRRGVILRAFPLFGGRIGGGS